MVIGEWIVRIRISIAIALLLLEHMGDRTLSVVASPWRAMETSTGNGALGNVERVLLKLKSYRVMSHCNMSRVTAAFPQDLRKKPLQV